jgi:hypothetical protein
MPRRPVSRFTAEPSSGFEARRIESQSVVERSVAQLGPIQATVAHQNELLPAIERSPLFVPRHPRPTRSTADKKWGGRLRG